MRKILRCALVALWLLVFQAAALAGQSVIVPGEVSYQLIGTYDAERLQKIVTTELDAFVAVRNTIVFPKAANGVKLYRVSYMTVVPEMGNKPVQASGLIAVPDTGRGRYPVVSYQHGTVFSRDEVPSFLEKSMETRLMVAHLAGNGYVVVAPDYIGKGVSQEPDSYMARESTVQACVDMLAASRNVLGALGVVPEELFLSGWSQGAWSTMVFRKRLEEMGVAVTAAATACTPTDPYVLMTRWTVGSTPLDAAWLPGIAALFINSYERYYGLQGFSRTAIRSEYWQTAKDFYENRIGWDEASKVFPATVKELLQDEFARESATVGNRFYRQLFDNQAYRWRYATPTRFYYGKIDEAVPPYVATATVEYQKAVGGASAEAVYAGDNADHRGTFIFGVRDQKAWFDGLRANK